MRMISPSCLSSAFALALMASCAASTAAENAVPDASRLFVFIGQKLQLTELDTPACERCIVMDSHFRATYRITEKLAGSFAGDVISFDVYDHYGVPQFSRFDNVLLFVSRQDDGSWDHEKYQFKDLYRGTDGQWYGCGDPYWSYPKAHRTVDARPVQFAEPVSYPLGELGREQIARDFPSKYFDIRDGRAYCTMGTSVSDLVKVKRETVLTARGYYKQAAKPRRVR